MAGVPGKRGPYLTPEELQTTRAAMAAHQRPDGTYNSTRIADELGLRRSTVQHRIKAVLDDGQTDGADVPREMVHQAWIDGPSVELSSRKDNTFCFLAFGDLHAASKYCRWDVREDLIRRAEKRGAQCAFDTGNWIDGDAKFNQFDVEERGMERQLQLLAREHPKTNLPIFAVAGDDHEGWYAQREGVNIGRYCEKIMREAGHTWTDLGFMESHVRLRNVNTGKSQIMAVNHPGGGSAYALSYRPQKIVEGLEGGEKPAIMLIGHYHKLEVLIVRNVWVIQTGCAQDQTPFLRKRGIEAHVGGVIVTLEQDPKTGAIIGCTAEILRYFNRDYYPTHLRWSHSGPVGKPRRTL